MAAEKASLSCADGLSTATNGAGRSAEQPRTVSEPPQQGFSFFDGLFGRSYPAASAGLGDEPPPAERATVEQLASTSTDAHKKSKRGKRRSTQLAIASPIDMKDRMKPKQSWLVAGPHAMRVDRIRELMKTLEAGIAADDSGIPSDASRVAKKNYELVLKATAIDKKRAAAAASYAEGPGLHTSIVRQLGSFKIFAHDHEGNRRREGGESVAVAIRGTSNVRARLTDNHDGSYTAEYRAWCSGTYNVAIWLNGEPIGPSPYELEVLSTKADPSKCECRGPGLERAISREPTSFEIEFVDAFDQVCYAEELDVYVELVYSPKHGLVGSTKGANYLKMHDKAQPASTEKSPAANETNAESVSATVAGAGELGAANEAAATSPAAVDAAADVTSQAPTERPGTSSPAGARSGTPPGTRSGTPPGTRSGSPAGARVVKKSRRAAAAAAAAGPVKPELTIESFLADGGGLSDEEMAKMRQQPPQSPTKLELLVPPSEYKRLDAIERQQHMQLWASRKALDQSQEKTGSKAAVQTSTSSAPSAPPTRQQTMAFFAETKTMASISYDHELKMDRKGCGFAYGGVSPGTLHAHGQLVRVHTVHYSIGLAGRYRLHVGLRQQSVPIPGSPFDVEVFPGTAYAPSTRLPEELLPLRSVVGEKWRGMVVYAADKIGNRCIKGGAKVQIHVDHEAVEATCTDHDDGSYSFKWRSQRAGTYSIAVTIDGTPVLGSPTTLTMLAGSLAVNNCEIRGEGLEGAVAGRPAVLRIVCKDEYSNLATPAPTLKFGLSLQQVETASDAKDKRKRNQSKDPDQEHRQDKNKVQKDDGEDVRAQKRKQQMDSLALQSFEGLWVDGQYEIRYVAQNAGAHQLHVWADPDGNGERVPVPGSPFTLSVVENDAAPASSSIGYPQQEEKKHIYAGDKLTLKPQLRDQFGNPAAAPEGARGPSRST